MQILGALLLGSGLLAAAGSKKRNINCMTASLTISLLGMLLAFEFITEVSPCCAALKNTSACDHIVQSVHLGSELCFSAIVPVLQRACI